jgi:hypothetical protein
MLKERFEMLTINFEDVTIIILNRDRAMWWRVDDGVRFFSFVAQLSCTEKLDLRVEEQDLIALLELF